MLLSISEENLQLMLERAAVEGARKALEELGLHDEDAGPDMREMRSLLEAWRDVRRTAWHTLVQTIVKGLLLLIVAGTAAYIWRNGP